MINEKLIPESIARNADVDKKIKDAMNNGTIIFENNNGVNNDIKFTVDISKYKYFEIYFKHQEYSSVIIVPNLRSFTIRSICWATSAIMQDAFLSYKIEKNKFSVIGYGYINFTNNTVQNVGPSSSISVSKVVAY